MPKPSLHLKFDADSLRLLSCTRQPDGREVGPFDLPDALFNALGLEQGMLGHWAAKTVPDHLSPEKDGSVIVVVAEGS